MASRSRRRSVEDDDESWDFPKIAETWSCGWWDHSMKGRRRGRDDCCGRMDRRAFHSRSILPWRRASNLVVEFDTPNRECAFAVPIPRLARARGSSAHVLRISRAFSFVNISVPTTGWGETPATPATTANYTVHQRCYPPANAISVSQPA